MLAPNPVQVPALLFRPGRALQPRTRRGYVIERAHNGGRNGEHDAFSGSPLVEFPGPAGRPVQGPVEGGAFVSTSRQNAYLQQNKTVAEIG